MFDFSLNYLFKESFFYFLCSKKNQLLLFPFTNNTLLNKKELSERAALQIKKIQMP